MEVNAGAELITESRVLYAY